MKENQCVTGGEIQVVRNDNRGNVDDRADDPRVHNWNTLPDPERDESGSYQQGEHNEYSCQSHRNGYRNRKRHKEKRLFGESFRSVVEKKEDCAEDGIDPGGFEDFDSGVNKISDAMSFW